MTSAEVRESVCTATDTRCVQTAEAKARYNDRSETPATDMSKLDEIQAELNDVCKGYLPMPEDEPLIDLLVRIVAELKRIDEEQKRLQQYIAKTALQ